MWLPELNEFFLFKNQPKPHFTTKKGNNGNLYAVVHLKGLSAITAIVRDKLCTLVVWGAMPGGLYFCFDHKMDDYRLWALAVIAPWLIYPFIHLCLGWLLARRKQVIIGASTLVYTRHFTRKTINRDIPLSFELIPHIRAKWEAQRHTYHVQRDRQKRRARYRKPYFQASFHVSVNVHHRLFTLITVYDEAQARKCLATLNAAKEQLDGMLGVGKGVAPTPEHEWRSQAGNLPD